MLPVTNCYARIKLRADAHARVATPLLLMMQNRVDAEKEQSKIKLLLLGAGESGKSTIFKQMRVIYGKGYSEDERKAMLPIIYANMVG